MIKIIKTLKQSIMKSNSLQRNNKDPFLKVIKNTATKEKSKLTRIYINTLIPNFSYQNSLEETISPKNCVSL